MTKLSLLYEIDETIRGKRAEIAKKLYKLRYAGSEEHGVDKGYLLAYEEIKLRVCASYEDTKT